jgi:prevent-host-death family protein
MAINISIPEAANQFVELLDRVKHGEEVTILEAGVAIARLVPAPKQRSPRIPGQDQGKVLIAPDFNAPLPEDILNDFLNPGLL